MTDTNTLLTAVVKRLRREGFDDGDIKAALGLSDSRFRHHAAASYPFAGWDKATKEQYAALMRQVTDYYHPRFSPQSTEQARQIDAAIQRTFLGRDRG